VLPVIERSGPIEAWIVDDTGFPKKGRHSVGVTRQYCGQLGKQDNCQVAVSLSLANHDASLPIAYRLYLPEDWIKDQARRDKARVPETIASKPSPRSPLSRSKRPAQRGLPEGVVLMDAGYGNDTGLRTDITALGLRYVAGIGPTTSVWPPGGAPLPPQSRTGRGTTADAAAARTAPADLGQDPRPQPAARGVANDHLARGEPRIGSPRALPGGECGRRIAITCCASCALKSGY